MFKLKFGLTTLSLAVLLLLTTGCSITPEQIKYEQDQMEIDWIMLDNFIAAENDARLKTEISEEFKALEKRLTQLISAGVNPIIAAKRTALSVSCAKMLEDISFTLKISCLRGVADIAVLATQEVPEAAIEIASAVIEVVPEAAAEIASAVIEVVPEAAAEIASAVIKVVPEAAVEIASAVTKMVPEAAAEIASAVIEVVPEAADDIRRAMEADRYTYGVPDSGPIYSPDPGPIFCPDSLVDTPGPVFCPNSPVYRLPKPMTPEKRMKLVEESNGYVTVRVFYGTDRKTTNKAFETDRKIKKPFETYRKIKMDQASGYYGDQFDKNKLHLGITSVSIPQNHRPGELESKPWWKFIFKANPKKSIVLLELEELNRKIFYLSLNYLLKKTENDSVFIFVHGYNVTFEDAIRRTAQLAYDMEFPGIPVTYSWPSKGTEKGYLADEDRVRLTKPHFKKFLEDIKSNMDPSSEINILAHSMGNRALTNALLDIAHQFDSPLFNQVILAAPDINAEIFKQQIAPKILKTAQHFTLYASSDDKALRISKTLHDFPRLGQSGKDIVIIPPIDTIDASGIDTSFLGHSYFGDQFRVIKDIKNLIKKHWTPVQRELKKVNKSDHHYWVFPELK